MAPTRVNSKKQSRKINNDRYVEFVDSVIHHYDTRLLLKFGALNAEQRTIHKLESTID